MTVIDDSTVTDISSGVCLTGAVPRHSRP